MSIATDTPLTVPRALEMALEHHRAGRLFEAERIYRAILDKVPQHPDALHLLGLIANQVGNPSDALLLITQALAIAPNSAPYTNSLGEVLRAMGRVDEAHRAFAKAIQLDPDYVDAHRNLAGVQPKEAPETVTLRTYQNAFMRLRRTVYMDYPAHVHLETMAQCNAACNFCPYPTLHRKGTRMPTELIDKVIDDLQEIPRDVPFQFSPLKVNEPFLDNRLFDILARVNEKLPSARVTLTSNATPITDKKLAQLSEVRNLHFLWISLNEYRPEEYTRIMQLPWERTLERLDAIHAYKASGRFAPNVVLSRVGDQSVHDDLFLNWVSKRFPLFKYSVFRRGGWLGQVDTRLPGVPDVGCTQWFEVSITASGIVAHCCMDGQAEHPIGDVNQQSVLEIYNSLEYRQLRERTLSRLNVAPCNSCTFL